MLENLVSNRHLQTNLNARATSKKTRGANPTAVQFDDAFGNRQPQSRAAILEVAVRIGTVEAFKNVRQLFGRNPSTSVTDLEPDVMLEVLGH